MTKQTTIVVTGALRVNFLFLHENICCKYPVSQGEAVLMSTHNNVLYGEIRIISILLPQISSYANETYHEKRCLWGICKQQRLRSASEAIWSNQ